MDICKKRVRTGAIVLAAGKGKRMGGDTRKQFLLLDGRPILYYSLRCFETSDIDDIILVTGVDDVDYCQREIVEAYGFRKVRAVVVGGKERYHSVYEGLKALGSLWNGNDADGYVLIHDGARPFIDLPIVESALEAAKKYRTGVVGMPVKDTIKIADADGFALATPKRSDTWLIQTPQSFLYPLIREAYEKMMSREEYQEGITDDAMVVETMTDCPVKLVEGSYENIKVTTPEDMEVAMAILNRRKTGIS